MPKRKIRPRRCRRGSWRLQSGFAGHLDSTVSAAIVDAYWNGNVQVHYTVTEAIQCSNDFQCDAHIDAF